MGHIQATLTIEGDLQDLVRMLQHLELEKEGVNNSINFNVMTEEKKPSSRERKKKAEDESTEAVEATASEAAPISVKEEAIQKEEEKEISFTLVKEAVRGYANRQAQKYGVDAGKQIARRMMLEHTVGQFNKLSEIEPYKEFHKGLYEAAVADWALDEKELSLIINGE